MSFVPNAVDIARAAMVAVNPHLTREYTEVVKFLAAYPELAKASSNPPTGSEAYIQKQAVAFAAARDPKAPQAPATVPDEMVSTILHEYFGIPEADLDRVKLEHQLSMGAENLVGDLLERYLASVLEPKGWVWCSGAMVRAVDLVKPPAAPGGEWRMLQVKNRDNPENSSSSAIRNGTSIEKWHRTFCKRAGSNWGAFPDAALRQHLSEDAFKTFVRSYLHALRN
ncbi:MAG: hypothetical protein B7X93_09720 [Hydrogenophilales bacterium 17-61-9]|nr:MAG: hypothetical protein B7X93_09720 [Hydrogenophilales bacterium 17-61-9]